MLEIKNIAKKFNKNTDHEINVFSNLSISINSSESIAIIGPNGCGKSTLMNLIAGNLNVDDGQILIDKKDVTNLREEERSNFIGRVYQNPSQGVAPSLSILENMSLADKKSKKFGLRKLVNKSRVDYYKSLLKDLDLGLENIMNTKVSFLSGGQRQSLSLVMAAMNHPKLLLLDEHTAALDPKTSQLVMRKTQKLIKDKGITTMMISHNMKDAVEFSDRVIMLDKGQVVFDSPSKNLTEEDLNKIYKERIDLALSL